MNMDAHELMWEMRKEYGLKMYQTGKLTLNQAAEFCGASMYQFISMLTLAGIPVISYSADELENEFEYLSKKMK